MIRRNYQELKRKDTKGITLIALVITIIVLLILAGVTIAMLTGENGILTKASDAKSGNTIGKEKEEIGLAYSLAKAEKLEKGDKTPVKEAELNTSLINDKVNATAKGDNPIIVEFKDTKNKYKVDNNGKIEETKTEEEIEKVESTSSLWKFDVETQTIQQYLGSDVATITEITVPNYIDGVQVKKIEIDSNTNEPIFGYNNGSKAIKLEKIIVSEGIESIGDATFMEIPQLKTVVLKKGLKRIEDSYAFATNRNLTDVTLPEGLEYIGELAFYQCSMLKKITLPASLQDIANNGLGTYEYIEVTALGNGNGTYFVETDNYEKPMTYGKMNFINENTLILTCGGGGVEEGKDDGGLTMFKLDRERKEATAVKRINSSGGGTYNLPNTVDGCAVKRIGYEFRSDDTDYMGFPENIEYIEKGAFATAIFFSISGKIEDLKKLKVEEGAINKEAVIFVEDKELTGTQFLSYCTVVPATH